MFVARHGTTADISNLWSIFEGMFFFFRQSDDKVLQAAKVTVMKKQSAGTQKYPSSINTILKKTSMKNACKARFLEFLSVRTAHRIGLENNR